MQNLCANSAVVPFSCGNFLCANTIEFGGKKEVETDRSNIPADVKILFSEAVPQNMVVIVVPVALCSFSVLQQSQCGFGSKY